MILTDLHHTQSYENLHPRFAQAFRWLAEVDLASFPDGRVDIDGQDLFALFETGKGHDPAQRRLETHRQYIDIQVNIAGGERIFVTPLEGLIVEDDFKPGVDLAFYHLPDRELTQLVLAPKMVAIFFPEDAHMPSLQLTCGSQSYHKLVMKVRI